VVFEYVMGSSVLDSCHPETEMGRAFGGLRRMNLSKLQIRVQSKGYESYFRLGGVGASLQVDDSGYGVIFRHAPGGGKGWRVLCNAFLIYWLRCWNTRRALGPWCGSASTKTSKIWLGSSGVSPSSALLLSMMFGSHRHVKYSRSRLTNHKTWMNATSVVGPRSNEAQTIGWQRFHTKACATGVSNGLARFAL
jgi:hypothetical protein